MSRRRHSDRTRATAPPPPPPPAPEPADPATRLRTAIDALTLPTTAILDRQLRHPACWCDTCAQIAAHNHHDRAELTHLADQITANNATITGPLALTPTIAFLAAQRRCFNLTARYIRVATRLAARQTGQAHIPALLEQLLQLGGSTNTKDGTAGSVYRTLMNPVVTELLADIAAHTRWDRHNPNPAALLAAVRNRPPDLPTAQAWLATAQQILTPPRRFTSSAPCPACAHATAHVRDDTGELVRRPALEIDFTTATARCLHCAETWDRDRFDWLARVLLDHPTPAAPKIRSTSQGRGGAWTNPAVPDYAPRIHFPLGVYVATKESR